MPDETNLPPNTDTVQSDTQDKLPKIDILSQVKYTYSNVAQVAVGSDVRIAFGDHMPPNRIEPLVGITLNPEYASRLAMSILAQLASSPHANRIANKIPVAPKEMSGAKTWKILQSEGVVNGVNLTFADGTERTIQGDDLTQELKDFLTPMLSVEKLNASKK